MTWTNPQPHIRHLEPTPWGWICSYPEGLEISDGVDIGCYSYLQARFGIKIGKNSKIGSHCALYSEDTIGCHSGPVVIEEGACIGTHSTILPNTIIGKSCRIGAYSLIKQGVILADGIVIPAYSFVKKSILTLKDLELFCIANHKDFPKCIEIDPNIINSYL